MMVVLIGPVAFKLVTVIVAPDPPIEHARAELMVPLVPVQVRVEELIYLVVVRLLLQYPLEGRVKISCPVPAGMSCFGVIEITNVESVLTTPELNV